jgi:hypothetical protein
MRSLFGILILGALSISGCYSEPTVQYRVRQSPTPLATDEVVRLSKAGVTDSVIVDQLKSRGISVRPNSDQIVELKKEGVSDAVIQAMNEVPIRSGQDVVVEAYPSPYPYYYPYYPYYYGPWWYGGPYWAWYYHYPYYHYPYYYGHYGHGPYYGSVHPYRH